MKQQFIITPRYEPYNLSLDFYARGISIVNNTRYGLFIRKGVSNYTLKPSSFDYSFPSYDYFVAGFQSIVIPVLSNGFSVKTEMGNIAPSQIVTYPYIYVTPFDENEKTIPNFGSINNIPSVPKRLDFLANTFVVTPGFGQTFNFFTSYPNEYYILKYITMQCSIQSNSLRISLFIGTNKNIFTTQGLTSVIIPLNIIFNGNELLRFFGSNSLGVNHSFSFNLISEVYSG